jgi:hypothetical protein
MEPLSVGAGGWTAAGAGAVGGGAVDAGVLAIDSLDE